MCRTYPGFTFPTRLAGHRDNACALRHSREEHALWVNVCQGSSASCCFLTAATGSGLIRSSLLAEIEACVVFMHLGEVKVHQRETVGRPKERCSHVPILQQSTRLNRGVADTLTVTLFYQRVCETTCN
jgi:hypothetical protein